MLAGRGHWPAGSIWTQAIADLQSRHPPGQFSGYLNPICQELDQFNIFSGPWTKRMVHIRLTTTALPNEWDLHMRQVGSECTLSCLQAGGNVVCQSKPGWNLLWGGETKIADYAIQKWQSNRVINLLWILSFEIIKVGYAEYSGAEQ